MTLKRWTPILLALSLALALSACGGQGTDAAEDQTAEQEELVEYVVEGMGVFYLPDGFTQQSGEITEPLPMTYVLFDKDEYHIEGNCLGPDAYELAGVAMPADVEEFSTRSGVRDAVPEGTVFDYDSCGNYAAQYTGEDGRICYHILLQGEETFGGMILMAPEDVFDADTAALWLSGSRLE